MASSKLETKLLSWGKTYAAVLMGLPTEQTLTEASAKLRQILQNTSNADSRKLEEAIEALVNNYSHKEYRVDSLVALCLTYTANKQRELLEWVEQEVVGADEETGHTALELSLNLHPLYHNELRAAQREKLKNEKELL